MANSKWWTDSNPKSNWLTDVLGLNLFNDAYHFFANLPRIVFGFWIWYEQGWMVGVAGFLVYGIADRLITDLLIEEEK
jgi:hypothetical protein